MTVHEIKIAPEYFGPVFDGIKTFEICKDDCGYVIGDLLDYWKSPIQLQTKNLDIWC